MINSIVEIGSPLANELGFTADKFDGYLWRIDNEIVISLIISLDPEMGNFRALVKRIKENGFTVAVPTPLGRMKSILIKWGFERQLRYEKTINTNVEYWVCA